ncbi:MAG: EF-hand protein [Rhodocyclales bacterium]|nr:EF-hand protein [Rhodocyclales bacterium]
MEQEWGPERWQKWAQERTAGGARKGFGQGFSQKRAVRNFLVISALYLSADPLHAARTVALKGIDFRQIDLNHDGYIDRSEAASRPEFAALLRTADTNHDGRLSETEFKAAQSTMKPGKI